MPRRVLCGINLASQAGGPVPDHDQFIAVRGFPVDFAEFPRIIGAEPLANPKAGDLDHFIQNRSTQRDEATRLGFRENAQSACDL